jgi:hypothetical protein
MAGGLFGKPFAFNIKCIIFSLIIMALFLYSPKIKNNYVLYGILFIIFIISYVAMAWYDYFFDCRVLPLRKGEKSWQKYIKPPPHQSEKQVDWICETDKSRKMILIYVSHIIFIVPMLAYIAIYKNKVNPIIYPLLGVLAIFTLGYHGMYLIFSSHN